jgi:hypothetical protein
VERQSVCRPELLGKVEFIGPVSPSLSMVPGIRPVIGPGIGSDGRPDRADIPEHAPNPTIATNRNAFRIRHLLTTDH